MKKVLLVVLGVIFILSGCNSALKEQGEPGNSTLAGSALVPAVLSCNVQAIKEASLEGEDLDAMRVLSQTVNPIVYSLEREGHCVDSVIEELLRGGADPNWADSEGNTLLMYAMGTQGYLYGNAEKLILLLVQYGAAINEPIHGGETALDYGISHNGLSVDGLKILLDNGASISTVSIEKAIDSTKSSMVLDSEGCEFLRLLFSAAPTKAVEQVNPFFYNVVMGESAQANDSYADNAVIVGQNIQWLYYAVAYCDSSVLKNCFQGALLSLSTDERTQALRIASRLSKTDVVGYLCLAFAVVPDDLALYLEDAVRYDNPVAVQILCENGAKINQYEPSPEFPWESSNNIMIYVGQHGDTSIIPWLERIGYPMDNGLAINYAAAEAVRYGHINVLSYFYPAEYIPYYESVGDLLQIAATNNDTDMIQCLMDSGYHTEDFECALESAAASNNLKNVKYLLKNGADISSISLSGPIRNGNLEMLHYLVAQGADVERTDVNGQTALFVAAQCPSVVIVQLLLDSGADVNKKDIAGRTPLSYAKTSATSSALVSRAIEKAGGL